MTCCRAWTSGSFLVLFLPHNLSPLKQMTLAKKVKLSTCLLHKTTCITPTLIWNQLKFLGNYHSREPTFKFVAKAKDCWHLPGDRALITGRFMCHGHLLQHCGCHILMLAQSFVATGHFFAGKGHSFPTLVGMELILTCSKCVVTEAFWTCPHVNDI